MDTLLRPTRRAALRRTLAYATALAGLSFAQAKADRFAWPRLAFTLPEMTEATEYSMGNHKGIKTDKVFIDAPDYVKRPGIVEVSVSAALPAIDAIAVLVRKNLLPLAAVYKLPPDTEPFVTSRIDIYESTEVIAVVRSEGKLFSNFRNVVISKESSVRFNEVQDPFVDLYDPYDDL